VFVSLPEPGASVTAGSSVSEVESTKSVSDIYAPISGTVVEVNTDLADAPQRINEDPYGDGWIFVIEASDAGAGGELLDPDAYTKLIG
jgi:glycine cleavage system H protein